MYSQSKISRKDLLYPELSYKIVGILIEVNRQIGVGHKEKSFQKALAIAFEKQQVRFQEQVKIQLVFEGAVIGIYFADFVIEDVIVLEIKTDRFFTRKNIDQVKAYLSALHLQLGILANFTKNGVEFKRIVNLPEVS